METIKISTYLNKKTYDKEGGAYDDACQMKQTTFVNIVTINVEMDNVAPW